MCCNYFYGSHNLTDEDSLTETTLRRISRVVEDRVVDGSKPEAPCVVQGEAKGCCDNLPLAQIIA